MRAGKRTSVEYKGMAQDNDNEEMSDSTSRDTAQSARELPAPFSPSFAALARAGTRRVYVDTADVLELDFLGDPSAHVSTTDIAGITVNQHFILKVLPRYLRKSKDASSSGTVDRLRAECPHDDPCALRYSQICREIGRDVTRMAPRGRLWDVSLPLHAEYLHDVDAAFRFARYVRRAVPSAIIKIPFMPHNPQCLLIARALEREGIPVNVTCTFSARQATVVTLLTNASRTNVFLGRINHSLETRGLGERVALAAQRSLLRVRDEAAARTHLIVASIHDWETLVRVAGCDIVTAPPTVLRDFAAATKASQHQIVNQLGSASGPEVMADQYTRSAVRRSLTVLYDVPAELIQLAAELRQTVDRDGVRDADTLLHRFDRAGFGDLFYSPTDAEWQLLSCSRFPDFSMPVADRLAIDTLFALLATADFGNSQKAIDRQIHSQSRESED